MSIAPRTCWRGAADDGGGGRDGNPPSGGSPVGTIPTSSSAPPKLESGVGRMGRGGLLPLKAGCGPEKAGCGRRGRAWDSMPCARDIPPRQCLN